MKAHSSKIEKIDFDCRKNKVSSTLKVKLYEFLALAGEEGAEKKDLKTRMEIAARKILEKMPEEENEGAVEA